MDTESNIDKLLARSAELDVVLSELFSLTIHVGSDRVLTSRIMCEVVFEHAESIKILIARGSYTSAFGLVRLQYEVVVRAVWLLYAASDQWVSTLLRDATPEGAEKANKLPSLSEMLKALDGKAPEVAVNMIQEFKDVSWKPLCSFVHGGFHALHRHGGGYPPQLVCQVLKIANGLSIMAGMLLVILSGAPNQAGRIARVQESFMDCLPDPKRDTQ